MIKLLLSYGIILAFTGFYYPYFARILELGLLSLTMIEFKIYKKTFFFISIIAFALVSLLYLVFHFERIYLATIHIVYAIRTPIIMTGTFLIFANILKKKNLLKFAINMWLFLYIFLFLDLFLFLLMGIQPKFSYGGGTVRVFGFADPNSFATFIWLTIIIARYYYQEIEVKPFKKFKILWFSTAAILFIFTGSRGAFVAAAFASLAEIGPAFYKFITSLKINRIFFYSIPIIFVFILITMFLLSMTNLDLISYLRIFDGTGGSHRLERWTNALFFMSNDSYNLLFGFPMSKMEIKELLGGWPHNSYVKLIINYGLLFTLLYFGLFIATFQKVKNFNLSLNLIIFIIFVLFTNDYLTSPIIGFYLGLTLAIHYLKTQSATPKIRERK